ncbi:PTS sugar transporter subunit IIA [Megamonas rupellensis]|uniref:Ascorbate-specific PTS system EIIA component n=1 Tax=Megamonas rupellensis TaxID=491921 RepID=A0A412CEV5_9FIRM|nr:PTS sugar transporter subunit IIA [Megamonas rupellensis]RGQ83823.1 PTS sugar transporter subunit IIA [Megamonas rupellensis]
MLKEFLKNNIILTDEFDSWELAIKQASEPLLEKNIIKESYVEAMINSVYKNGPYMIIMPHIALAHARPEDGVNENGISFLKLKIPVIFPQENDVDIIIVLAAKEDEGHLELMAELADLLVDDEKTEAIRRAHNKNQIKEILFSE